MKKDSLLGVDVGGTKISAAVVRRGRVVARRKIHTPKGAPPSRVFKAIVEAAKAALAKADCRAARLLGMGVGVPGIVDAKGEKVLAAPNIRLAGFPLRKRLAAAFRTRAALGNDVNLGLLGEQRFGAARGARSVVGLFPGTGIGGAVILDGRLEVGAHGAGGELGHMIVEPGGPECGCGNRGCLEALASRRAIEREIRAEVRRGAKTVLTKLTGGDLTAVRSKLLKKALKKKDPLVTRVMRRNAEILGAACVSLRHVYDPELFVFGGGVFEACAKYMLPVIRKSLAQDPFFKDVGECGVAVSELGDEAVLLGAAAMARDLR